MAHYCCIYDASAADALFARYSLLQHSVVQHNVLQHSTAYRSTAQAAPDARYLDDLIASLGNGDPTAMLLAAQRSMLQRSTLLRSQDPHPTWPALNRRPCGLQVRQ
jgi:hypothetical protein